jgi:hypothetical protein
MPPKTNWTEVAILLGLVILVGFVHWLTRLMVRSKLQILDQKLNDVRGNLGAEELAQIAMKFNWRLSNLLLCTLPLLGLWSGNTFASLMRDRGFMIFPWLILLGPVLAAILAAACERVRLWLLRRTVAQEAIKNTRLARSSTAPLHAPFYDDNPYSPPKS